MDIAQATRIVTDAMEEIGIAANEAKDAREKVVTVVGQGFDLDDLKAAASALEEAHKLLEQAYAKCQEAL